MFYLLLKQGGVEHAHAFVYSPEVIRFCSVTYARGGLCFFIRKILFSDLN